MVQASERQELVQLQVLGLKRVLARMQNTEDGYRLMKGEYENEQECAKGRLSGHND